MKAALVIAAALAAFVWFCASEPSWRVEVSAGASETGSERSIEELLAIGLGALMAKKGGK